MVRPCARALSVSAGDLLSCGHAGHVPGLDRLGLRGIIPVIRRMVSRTAEITTQTVVPMKAKNERNAVWDTAREDHRDPAPGAQGWESASSV